MAGMVGASNGGVFTAAISQSPVTDWIYYGMVSIYYGMVSIWYGTMGWYGIHGTCTCTVMSMARSP